MKVGCPLTQAQGLSATWTSAWLALQVCNDFLKNDHGHLSLGLSWSTTAVTAHQCLALSITSPGYRGLGSWVSQISKSVWRSRTCPMTLKSMEPWASRNTGVPLCSNGMGEQSLCACGQTGPSHFPARCKSLAQSPHGTHCCSGPAHHGCSGMAGCG